MTQLGSCFLVPAVLTMLNIATLIRCESEGIERPLAATVTASVDVRTSWSIPLSMHHNKYVISRVGLYERRGGLLLYQDTIYNFTCLGRPPCLWGRPNALLLGLYMDRPSFKEVIGQRIDVVPSSNSVL